MKIKDVGCKITVSVFFVYSAFGFLAILNDREVFVNMKNKVHYFSRDINHKKSHFDFFNIKNQRKESGLIFIIYGLFLQVPALGMEQDSFLILCVYFVCV